MSWSGTLSRHVEAALRGLRYGSVQIVVHDQQVVRIERIERIRLATAIDAAQAGLTDTPEAPSDTSSRPTDPPGGPRHVPEE